MNTEHTSVPLHRALKKKPLQRYLIVTWDAKSDFWGATMGIYIKKKKKSKLGNNTKGMVPLRTSRFPLGGKHIQSLSKLKPII